MSITTLLRDFLGKDYLPKMILFLLVFAAVPLAEVFLFLYLGNLVGNYLVLVMAAVAGMAGALIAFDQFRRGLPRCGHGSTRPGTPAGSSSPWRGARSRGSFS
jgi:hypothetical protein